MGLKRFFLIFFLLLFSLFIYNFYIFHIHTNNTIEKKLGYNIYNIKSNILRKNNILNIKTDVINLKVNLIGGNIQEAKLLKYQNKVNDLKKLKLLSIHNNSHDNIRSGFIINNYKYVISEKNFHYLSDRINFELINGKKILFVPIVTIVKKGIYFVKTFILEQGSYNIKIQYKIYNTNIHPISCFIFDYLKKKTNPKNFILPFNKNTINNNFENIAFSKDDVKYKKMSFNDFIHDNLYFVSYSGWIAILQKYFSIAWFFDNFNKNIIYTSKLHNNKIILGHHSSTFHILQNQKKIIQQSLWIGPNIPYQMSLIAPYFNYIVDYGWFWFISIPLLHFLNILYILFNNLGYSIIIITCIVRILAYPLVKSQYIAALRMKLLQPEIEKIKNDFKNNKKKSNEKILQLYQKNNISPFSGLLPTILQMPIFLSLYYMLMNAIELRHASFIFWIHDLSSKDPYYILPILMGITMFVIQKISPSNLYNTSLQGNITDYIPILLSLCFLWLPSGLVLYYIISNIITIIQQLFIYYNFKN